MSADAPQNERWAGRQVPQFFVEQCFDNRDEGIAVVIAKRREPVTLKTNLQKLRQGQFFQTISFPQIFCWNVTVGGWFVEGFASFAKRGIDGNDGFEWSYRRNKATFVENKAVPEKMWDVQSWNVECDWPMFKDGIEKLRDEYKDNTLYTGFQNLFDAMSEISKKRRRIAKKIQKI